MDADHARFAELAVGHVLGGLSTTDARRFQSHLQSCADCRTRVAELRDIASDLAAAEEDERSRSPLRTDVGGADELGHDEGAEPTPTRRLTVGHVTVAVIVVLVLAIGVLFWNLHLRAQVAGYEQLLEAQSDALAVLATGTELPAELADGVTGVIASDGERVAITLAGMELRQGDVVSTWLLDEAGEATEVARAPAGLLEHGSMSAVVEVEDVAEIVVTREDGTPGEAPDGDVIARIALDGGGA